MKVLVLGGNRFIGADLVSRMVVDGHDVTVAALDPPIRRARPHTRFIRLDRRSRAGLSKALGSLEFDVVLDNIAFLPSDVELFLDVMGNRIGRYIMTSSVDIYPASTTNYYAEKSEVFSPAGLENASPGERYLRGKRACESVLRESSIAWSVVRPAMAFGLTDPVAPAPKQFHGMGNTYSRSLFFPTRIMDRGPVLLRQDERRAFSLASSQDVASALAVVASHPDAQGRAFNVAGDEVWTLERLLHAMGATIGHSPEVVRPTDEDFQAAGLGDYEYPYRNMSRWSIVDNRNLRSLGWSPVPATVAFSRLLEAVPPEGQRPFYDRRLQEIALASQVVRRHEAMSSIFLPAAPARKKRPAPSARRQESRFSKASVEAWQAQITAAPLASHFREFEDIPVSSIGIGTFRGNADTETSDSYHQAIVHAVRGGINVIDTAINYRRMLAERTVGRAVTDLVASGIPRSALCICSKGGFIPSDEDDPRPRYDYIWDEYVAPGLIDMRDAMDRHTLRPAFIRKLLDQSLANLGLSHIDVYYLHNPERARARMGEGDFFANLRSTFEVLEQAAHSGEIGCYGIATWSGLRTSPDNPAYLSLEKIHALAVEVGGPDHHFKAVQFPLNVRNSETLYKATQAVGGRAVTVVEAASRLGLHAFTSTAVCRGQELAPAIRERLGSANESLDEIQGMLNFARSVSGPRAALIGMRKAEYAEKALQLASQPMMAQERIACFEPSPELASGTVDARSANDSKAFVPSLVIPSLAGPPLRTLVAGGEVMLGRDLPGHAAEFGTEAIIGDLPSLLSTADVAMVNLECVLSARGEYEAKGERRPFHYRCPPMMTNLLVELGVTAVTTANNHSFDYGSTALGDQGRLLDEAGIGHAGSGADLCAASRPLYLAAGDLVVAVISFETQTPAHAAGADRAGIFHVPVNDQASDLLAPVIEDARRHADVVLVSPHWGMNWKEAPAEPIRQLARRLIDLGASAVLGHGAHILHGVEVYRGCPIVFDMGGLIFDRNAQSRMRQSALFELGLDSTGVRAVAVHPVKLVENAASSATGKEARAIRDLMVGLSAELGTDPAWRQQGEALVLQLSPERDAIATSAPPAIHRRETVKALADEAGSSGSAIIHEQPPAALAGLDGLDLGGGLQVLGFRHPDRVQPGFSFLLEVLFRCPQTRGEHWRASIRAEPIGEEGAAFRFRHPVADGLWTSQAGSGMSWVADAILMRPPASAKPGRYQLSWALVHRKSGRIWPAIRGKSAPGWARLGVIELTNEAPRGVAGVAWDTDIAWRGVGPEDTVS